MRDMNLSPRMREALQSGFAKRRISECGKNTQRALLERRLVSEDGVLTSQCILVVLEWQSLNNQCRELGLLLEELSYQYTSSPEIAAYEYFSQCGYVGAFCEGGFILTVIKALCLDKLAQLNIFKSRDDACTRFLEAQFTILGKNHESLFGVMRKTSRTRFIENYNEILTHPFISEVYPGMTVEAAEAFYDAVGIVPLERVARKFASNPYQFRNGWPDLTLVKGSEVRFIEVKTGDKLHRSQLVTIPVMQPLLPATFSVLRMKKQG